MFGLGIWELLIIFGIILLLFGGNRLPEIATGLGNAIRNFRTEIKDENIDNISKNNSSNKKSDINKK